jgi:hypothetical protein
MLFITWEAVQSLVVINYFRGAGLCFETASRQRFFMAVELTASQWHIVYKFFLVWSPIYGLTKHSVAWFSSSSFPVGLRAHDSISHTFSVLAMCWCDPWNTVDMVGHVVKKAAQTLCRLGLPWEMGVLDCKQSVFPQMDYACCRSLFLWDTVLHQWCPTFWDSVLVLSSGVLYAGHFWHHLCNSLFVQLYVIVTYLRNGVLRWRQFTSPVCCKQESSNLVYDTRLLIAKELWVHIDWCLCGHQSQYE